MRDPKRLESFYDEIKKIHKESFPDMREGQFLLNVLGWIHSEKHRDPFFPETDELINLFKEYANSNSPFYRGWDILKDK